MQDYVHEIKTQITKSEEYKIIESTYKNLFKTKYNIASKIEGQKFIPNDLNHTYSLTLNNSKTNSYINFDLNIQLNALITIKATSDEYNAYKGTWNSQTNKQKFLNLKNTDTITKDLFTNENNLTSLTIRKGKLSRFGSEDSLFGQNGLTKLTNLTLANITWTSIPYRCFGGVKNVVNLDLSGCLNLKTIGNCSFEYCQNMTKILFPKSLESIERHAFYKANKLTNLNLSNTSIKTLSEKTKEYPFGIDNKIENLNLEKCSKLTTINYWSFYNSKNLKTINFKGCTSLKTIGEYLNTF